MGYNLALKLLNQYGSKPVKRPPLPKSATSLNFHDPAVGQFLQYLVQRDARQDARIQQQRQLLKGFRLGPEWDQYFFPLGPGPDTESSAGDSGSPWYADVFNKTVDVLMRGNYAAAEGVADFQEQLPDVINGIGLNADTFGDVADMFRAGAAGAWQGLSGQKKTTFSDIIRGNRGLDIAGPLSTAVAGKELPFGSKSWYRKHDKAAAAASLTADIMLDPFTYVGVGAVGKLGTGARLFKDAASVNRSVKSTEQIVKELSKQGALRTNKVEEILRDLTAQKYRMGFQSQKGAKAFEGRAINNIRNISFDKGSFVGSKVYGDTLENLKKIGPVGLKDRKGKFMSPNTVATEAATKAAQETEEMTTKTLLDNYRTVVGADYKRTLGIGTRKVRLPIIPSKGVEGMLKIAQVKPLRVTSEKLQSALRNSYKTIEDVYRVKVEAMHLGRSSTMALGRYVESTFKQIDKDSRRAAWVMGLRRQSTNGELSVRAPGAAQSDDAAELFSRHVASLDERARGDMGELPFSPEELNRELAPGLPAFFKKKSKKEIAMENGWITSKGKLAKGKKDELQRAWEDQEWIRSSLLRVATDTKMKGMKDGGHALWMAIAAMEHANARRKMYEAMVESFGFSKAMGAGDNIAKAILSDLEKRGWREAKIKGSKQLDGVLFNKDVATSIERIMKTFEDQREWKGWVKFFNRITNPWKFWVTQPMLGYHIRNMMGDAFVNFIDGAVNPADYRASARMLGLNFSGMKKFEHVTETQSPLLRIPGDPMANALRVTNKPLFRNSANLRDAEGKVKDYVTDAELFAGLNKHGIRQNLQVGEFGDLESEINTFGTRASDVRQAVEKPFRLISEQREEYMRIAHFIHLVRTNPSKAITLDEAMEWAGQRVRMTHFDYTDFTKFEQQTLSNVIPFYKWTRKALPLMARFMFEHPGKVVVPEKITRALSGAYGYWPTEDDPLPGLENLLVPQWLKEGGYEPGYDTPTTGNPMFLRMPSPFSDILSFQANSAFGSGNLQGLGDTLMQQTNPLIRIPYELATGHQTLIAGQDVPIGNPAEYGLNQLPVPYLRQVLSATGAFKGGEGNLGPVATATTGLYSRELTERDQRNELYRLLFEGNLSSQDNARIRQILLQQFGVDLSP